MLGGSTKCKLAYVGEAGAAVVGMNWVEVTMMVVAMTLVVRDVTVACIVCVVDPVVADEVYGTEAIVGGGGMDAFIFGDWTIVVATKAVCSSVIIASSAANSSCAPGTEAPRVISPQGLSAPHDENNAKATTMPVTFKSPLILPPCVARISIRPSVLVLKA